VSEGTVSHLLFLKQIGEQEGYRKSPGEPDSHRLLEFKAHGRHRSVVKDCCGKVNAKKKDKVGGVVRQKPRIGCGSSRWRTNVARTSFSRHLAIDELTRSTAAHHELLPCRPRRPARPPYRFRRSSCPQRLRRCRLGQDPAVSVPPSPSTLAPLCSVHTPRPIEYSSKRDRKVMDLC
jgi:hypothetical protein